MKINTSTPLGDRKTSREGGMEDLEHKVYDASCISALQRCPGLFYHRYIMKRVEKDEPPARHFGFIIHKCLEVWYRTGDVEKALTPIAELPPASLCPKHHRALASTIIEEYVERFPTEHFTIKDIEVCFAVEMGNGRFYSGRIDLVIEDAGSIYVFDHKTSGGWPVYERPSLQFDGYCYACEQLYGQCSGVVINKISTAKAPRGGRFSRTTSARTQREMQQFKETFDQWAERIESCNHHKSWPLATSNCGHFGGCRYSDLCIYGEQPSLITRDFKIEGE